MMARAAKATAASEPKRTRKAPVKHAHPAIYRAKFDDVIVTESGDIRISEGHYVVPVEGGHPLVMPPEVFAEAYPDWKG